MLERLLIRFKKDAVLPLDKARAEGITLEIKDCFDYFQKRTPKVLGESTIISIHGIGITINRLSKDSGYIIEINGKLKRLGQDMILPAEKAEIMERIHNMTIPYAEHVKAKK